MTPVPSSQRMLWVSFTSLWISTSWPASSPSLMRTRSSWEPQSLLESYGVGSRSSDMTSVTVPLG